MLASEPKVIVQIAGGLGNQLFQYAMGRRLSLANGVPLVLDHLSGFPVDFYKRKFTLDRFSIQCDFVPPAAAHVGLAGRARRRLRRLLNRHLPIERRAYVEEEPSGAFDARLLDLTIHREVFFHGYWQHEGYFRDVAPQIRQDLAFNPTHDPLDLAVAKRIHATNAVCLHVRRLHGVPNQRDAKPLPEAENLHLGMAYYQRAMDFMSGKVEDPHFFVFSDFPQWARDNIHSPHPVEFVVHNGPDKDYADLWLMAQCRHFVIANSTFSWWAAWLGTHPGKTVVAPATNVGTMPKSIPREWIAL